MHGDIVVLDSKTGKAITALPIGGLLDYMVFAPQNRRVVVCSDGYVYVYGELTPEGYVLLGKVETAFFARTGLLVTELNRFFVLSPTQASGLPNCWCFRFSDRKSTTRQTESRKEKDAAAVGRSRQRSNQPKADWEQELPSDVIKEGG